eukprot:1493396-Pleurochrysis_carterae.AAC.1
MFERPRKWSLRALLMSFALRWSASRRARLALMLKRPRSWAFQFPLCYFSWPASRGARLALMFEWPQAWALPSP